MPSLDVQPNTCSDQTLIELKLQKQMLYIPFVMYTMLRHVEKRGTVQILKPPRESVDIQQLWCGLKHPGSPLGRWGFMVSTVMKLIFAHGQYVRSDPRP